MVERDDEPESRAPNPESRIDAPIGVFDSGVGGLSVLREISRELPAEDLIYVADSGYAPYGDRPEEYVRGRAVAIMEFLRGQGAKAVVVACNTATGIAVDALRTRYDVPIVAIEPAGAAQTFGDGRGERIARVEQCHRARQLRAGEFDPAAR